MGRERLQMKLYDQKLDIYVLMLLIGDLVAVFSSRTFVQITGILGINLLGVTVQHLYIGAVILLISTGLYWLRRLELRRRGKALAFLGMGAGIGLMVDQINLLFYLGHQYDSSLYYHPVNLYADLTMAFALILLVVWSDDR